ncbi:MAG: PH domain-containing protein [Alphaproteobacteria bacterium]|nr:PH domain-containing protein [Alphaproteobacteria bacterium]
MSLELRPNEYVLIEVHYSYKVFVFPMLLMCIGILMFIAVWSGVFEGVDVHWLRRGFKMSSLMAGLSCVLFVPYIFKRLDNKLKIYAVTNQRVYIRKGIINIHEKDIPLAKINDVQVVQTLGQRMFGAGNIVIQVGNDKSNISVQDVNRPREFRDTIISAIYEWEKEEESRQREYQQSQYDNGYNDGGYNQGGYNQGGYGQGYNQGSYNQGGYGQGYNQGGYNQGGYGQGYNQGGYNQGGYGQGGYNQGGYNDDYNNSGGYNPNRF